MRAVHALALAFASCQLGCSDADPMDPPVGGEVPPPVEPNAAPPGACKIASHCLDIDVEPLTSRACCTAAYSCGYILPDLDPETF